MIVTSEPGATPIKAWIPDGHPVEKQAVEQLRRVSRMPFVTDLACMPDVHVGFGATIGSVIGTNRAIIPAAVGVDIGCGMMAVPLDIPASQLPDNLEEVRFKIEAAVPHGRTSNGQAGDRGAFDLVPWPVEAMWTRKLGEEYGAIVRRHPKIKHPFVVNQLSTLGTGNHFIEVCVDEADRVWLMLHSGSRGAGNRIGTYFINLAKEDMKRHHITVEDKDLSYLSEGTDWFDDYVQAVSWAQEYARLNRVLMMTRILAALTTLGKEGRFPEIGHLPKEVAINCHHNYVAKENHRGRNIWVTRKGAVQARSGTLGIIPGSMGARSFIVRGKGNPDSLNSCSHGAGRVMSRTQARREFTVEDLKEQTDGVECRKDSDVIDEIPGAYKDIDAVMKAQEDLVMIVHTLKQIVCVKG